MPDWIGMGFGDQVGSVQETAEDIDFLAEVGEFIPLWREPGATAIILEDARNYLTGKRKLEKETWEQASIGACMRGMYAQRLIVPIFNEEGDDWAGFVSRTWQKNGAYRYPPGMSREMFYEQQLLREQTDEPLIVVEGVLDALPYFGQAVACLGKPTNWHRQELLTVKDRPIALCLDGDASRSDYGGLIESETIAMELRFRGAERVGFVQLPPGEDPNSVDPDWLLEEARRCVR
jgi:DNA primase